MSFPFLYSDLPMWMLQLQFYIFDFCFARLRSHRICFFFWLTSLNIVPSFIHVIVNGRISLAIYDFRRWWFHFLFENEKKTVFWVCKWTHILINLGTFILLSTNSMPTYVPIAVYTGHTDSQFYTHLQLTPSFFCGLLFFISFYSSFLAGVRLNHI